MWVLIAMVQILAVDLPAPLELGQHTVDITLIAAGDEDMRQRVNAIAADPAANVVLQLHGVEADETPAVSWEVYVASSDTGDCHNTPALAGVLSLYGASPGADFVIPLDSAIVASQPLGLKVVFKPVSGVEVHGQPVAPIVRTTVRIGGISLASEGTVAAPTQ